MTEPVKDPVCGMTVNPETARGGSHQHAGNTYYFCNPRCRERFAAEPLRFLSPAKVDAAPQSLRGAPAAPVVAVGVYTCPMHPEIRKPGPGSCPICGMALERATVSLDEPEDDTELRDFTRRLLVSAALSLPTLLLAMSEMLPGEPWLAPSASAWLQFALSTPVVAWCGFPFFQRGFASIVTRQLNMFTLIAIGT
ncbi:MAG TPA: heavy metal-binding domain-containing protein, partial [Polyangiaceae bacterium]|nr:heavy metal-binding domain-containing protein [Polyangiaceae bacterium]